MVKSTQNKLIFIAFDLDDTLWDMRETMAVIQTNQQQWLATRFPQVNVLLEDAKWLDPVRKKFAAKRKELGFNPLNFRKAILHEAFQACSIQPQLAEKNINELLQMIMLWRNQVKLHSGVIQTLANLSAKFTLGVITNGNADINAIGLGQYFMVNIRALDVGCEKPDPEIFQCASDRAANKLGTTADSLQCIYIGDDQTLDMQGAHQMGWDTIWFNAHHLDWQLDMQQPVTTDDFHQIPKLIDQLI